MAVLQFDWRPFLHFCRNVIYLGFTSTYLMNLPELQQKILRKGYRLLSKIAPIHAEYKPKRVINISASSKHEDIKYIEIGPPYTLHLDLDPEFVKLCSPYMKPPVEVQYPGDFILEITNGRLYSLDPSNMGVITSDGDMIEQVSFQWANDEILTAKDNKLFTETLFSKPRKYKGSVFSLLAGGGAVTYYYHWLFDAMPKFFLLQRAGLFEKMDYFLVPNNALPFQKELLRLFGVPQNKIINALVENHIEADTLYVASYVRLGELQPKWACDFLRRSLVKESAPTKNRRIYVSRKDALVNRQIYNEDELIDVLKSYGFEIVLLAKMSVAEQAKLFNEAEIVVGAHGAGFSNLVFCQPGTKVLEFFPENYVRHSYYDICNRCELEYDYLLCPCDGDPKNAVEGQKINITADVQKIRAKVDRMLNKTSAL